MNRVIYQLLSRVFLSEEGNHVQRTKSKGDRGSPLLGV